MPTVIFFKMAAGEHFASLIWAILDDPKSLLIAFLAISDQYTTFFHKMAASGHFDFLSSKWPALGAFGLNVFI